MRGGDELSLGAWLAAAALLITGGCTNQAETGGGAGGGGQTQIPADQASTPEECVFLGFGGSNSHACDVVTVQLSELVALDGLTVAVETSLGHSLTTIETPPTGGTWAPEGQAKGDPWLETRGDPADALLLRINSPPPHYAPDWVEVTLHQGSVELGSERFETLSYSCHDLTVDDWCWEAAPVTLSITPVDSN